jgi:hypothetical protein
MYVVLVTWFALGSAAVNYLLVDTIHDYEKQVDGYHAMFKQMWPGYTASVIRTNQAIKDFSL